MNELYIIVVSDGAPDLEAMARSLGNGRPVVVRLAHSLDELAALLPGHTFDLALGVDALPGPGGSAAPVLPLLAGAEPALPFIAVVPAGGHARGLAALEAGASDYLTRDEPGRLPAAAARALRDAARQRGHVRLERSEAMFRAYFQHLFEHSPEGIVFLDNERRIVDVNAGFCTLFDYAAEELAGRSLADTIVPDRMQEEHEDLFARMGKACVALTETARRRKDGSEVRVSVLGCPVVTTDGRAAYSAMYTDLTSRQKALETLRRAESNYRDIFLNAVEGIYLSTPVGRFVLVNPALADLLGFDSPGDLADNVRSISREIYVDPEDREEFVRRVRSQGSVLHFRARMRRKDGRIIEVLENARAVFDEDGELLYYQGAVHPASA